MNKYFKISILILAILSLVLFACQNPAVGRPALSDVQFKLAAFSNMAGISLKQGGDGGNFDPTKILEEKTLEILDGAKLIGNQIDVRIIRVRFRITFGNNINKVNNVILTLDNAQLTRIKGVLNAADDPAVIEIPNGSVKLGGALYTKYIKEAGKDIKIQVGAISDADTDIVIDKSGIDKFKALLTLLTTKNQLKDALELK